MRRARWSSVGALVAFAGCATMLASYPPPVLQRGSYPVCGTPPGAVGFDVVALGLAGTFTVAAGTSGSEGDSGTALVSALIAAAFAASAANGVWALSRCREAHAAGAPHLMTAPLRVPLPPPSPTDAGAPDAASDAR